MRVAVLDDELEWGKVSGVPHGSIGFGVAMECVTNQGMEMLVVGPLCDVHVHQRARVGAANRSGQARLLKG